MELLNLYMRKQIFKILIDIYNLAPNGELDESIDPSTAFQYITYRNLISDELGDNIYLLLNDIQADLNISKIQQELLEIYQNLNGTVPQ